MTLLIALQTDSEILFWGDGKGNTWTLSDHRSTISADENVCKVMPCSSPGVMWGFAGANAIGLDLALLMDGEVFQDWPQARTWLQTTISEIRGGKRAAVRGWGGDPDNAGLDATSVFAGLIGDKTKILRINQGAVGEFQESLAVEGEGANEFRVLWNTYRELHPEVDLFAPGRFLKFVNAYAANCGMLHFPGRLWVHSNGVWKEWKEKDEYADEG